MEQYLSACSKTAKLAANKAASGSLTESSQQCGDGAHKVRIPGVGAAQLLDLPLGVKLPVIPGTHTVYFTTNIGEKLFQLSDDFNLSDPYCRLLETQYKCLHDPHLRTYYKRKAILRRLKKGGYITNNNKIVCNLRELNKYRQYLTNLKIDFERNYVREQQSITKQLHKLQETSQFPHCSDITRFQNWLLQDNTQSIKDQEHLLRHRYLGMISRELEQLDRTAEEQRLLRMDREERRQREYTRKKLHLRRKIEEEWKTKEMLLLSKIGEDAKREQRVEEQRRKSQEESDRKKQAILEKKMAYHLQKMQDTDIKDDMGRNAFDYKGQNGTAYESFIKKKKKQFDDIKVVYPGGDQESLKGTSGQVSTVVNQSQSSSKNITKISGSSVAYQTVVQNSSSEQKTNGVTKKISDEKVPGNTSTRESIIPAQNSPTKTNRLSHSSLCPQKEEQHMKGDWNGKPSKKSSYVGEPGSQGGAPPPGFFSSPVYSNTQQNLQNCLQNKVTSEELNSIIQNIMTWVVATVTSILYPAITKYEERVQSHTYSVSDDSDLSSDSSSFCSTCSEGFTYRNYIPKAFQADPCVFASDRPVKKPPTPLKPPSAHVERTVTGTKYQVKGQSMSSQVNYNKSSLEYPFPKIGSSKSDSYLLTSLETSTKKSKDVTTETDSLEIPFLYDKKAKAMDQMKNLKNVFVNFKCHLKGETELILESIFQEIISDLTQAIPSLSSVTAEVFVDQYDTEREDLLSNVDICSVASEIVENILESLQSAVEKQCVQMFSQEDLTVDIKTSFSGSADCFSSLDTKPSEDTLTSTLEPMCDIADDMVHAILEKLMTLASYKKSELPLEDTTKHFHQQIKTEPIFDKFHQKSDQKKSGPESDAADLIVKEEIQNLISNIFSQSYLVGYVEEAINTILGCVQTELNNERLIASEETIVLLQLLDDVLTQLHQGPAKADVKKHRKPRVRNLPDAEEKYRLTSAGSFNGLRTRRSFPSINVPGMVLYSEDDEEEIDNLVRSVLDSSLSDEKIKPQEQIPIHWPRRRDTCFESKRSDKLPTKPTPQSKVGSHDCELKLKLSLSGEDIMKTTHCLTNDASIFSQDQKHQIQKASENIIKHILTEMLNDMSFVSSHHPGRKIGEETSAFISEKSKGLSDQEWKEEMFSESEICAFAHEITDSVINILYKASKCIPNTIKNTISSVHQICPDHPDTSQTTKEKSSKIPFKVWFDSEKKMKYLSSLNIELEKSSPLRSQECEPKYVNDITDKIINTIFKNLKLFVCPKLQTGKKSLLVGKSLHSQLSTYTMKIVNIVLDAIQNELEFTKINPNPRETDHTKCRTSKGWFADSNEAVDSHVTGFSDATESPLLTCIYELISSANEDQTNTSTSTDKAVSTMFCRSENANKQNILLSKQDKNSFRQYLATPCIHHSIANGKDLKDSSKLQVLDRIGETLHEMLSKLTGSHPDSQPSCSQQNTEKLCKDPPTLSNVQLISNAILEYVLAKLCNINIDTSIVDSGLKTGSESLDIDNLSFASTMEEMAKCINIISNIISKMMMGNKEIMKNKAKNDLPVSPKTENSKEMCPNKLKTIASDILNMVFAKLEGFANGNVENIGLLNDENKTDNKMDWECEGKNSPTDSHDKSLQSTLYTHAKKASSAILKAIQTELNINPSDCKKNTKNSPQETQFLTNIVDLILDVVSSDMFVEPESEHRDIENYRYRPIYGNFLPGGAESGSFLDDDTQNKEFTGDRTSPTEETRTFSTDQWVLERTLNKIEVKLKEPHKSPIVPIIRNILNEIFQSALINQLNVVSLSHSHFSSMPYNVPVSTTQTSAQFTDPLMGPLVSDTDVTKVVNDVVRTVFHKLYSAATKEKHESGNRCETIIFSTNVSYHEPTYPGNQPVSVLNGNPCDIQSSWNVDRQTKINVVEDIVQAILENLETFAASKVESLFLPHISFRVPVTLPVQQEGATLSKALSGKDSYADKQFSCCSVDYSNPGKMDSWCQLSLSKLNIYAKEVARKILQGIKHELDKEQESLPLANNIVVSENIASQVVSTVLDIVSSKSKCDKNSCDKDNYSEQQDGIIERLVNKTEYRKILEFQIQDTIERILCDIYENIMYQNNLSFATPTLQYNIPSKHSEANLQPVVMGTNIIPKVSVPKTDVILVSKDIVDIVLHNLTSLVMLAIKAKDPASSRLAFYDMFPKSQCQQPLFITQRTEEQPGHFSHSRIMNLAYDAVYQMPVKRNKDTREPAPDPCEENANFITKTIFNRLQSFATERINSLMTPTFKSNKENVFISPEFENGKQDDSTFHESGQVESDVNVLKLSTTKADPSQELAKPIFASCRENLGTTIHLSQTSLKDYADFIASAILKLIKNDLDLEIQSVHTCSNNILFQKNTVSEIVNSILNILHNKGSEKDFFLSSPENSSCSQLTISNEVLLGYKEREKTTTLSQFTKDPLEEKQTTMEKESQRSVLEEIFLKKGGSKPREKNEIFSAVEEVLKKLNQNIMEIIGHLLPFIEIPYIVSKSKSKTSAIAWKKFFQSHINNISNDILENILEKMHSVVVTSLYKKTKSRIEVEMYDNHDTSSVKPPCFRENKPARKRSNPPRLGVPQMHHNADSLNALVLENTFLPYSPLQIGRYLVQMVLDKLSNFVSLHLEERFPPEGSYDDMYLLRLHNSKLSPKNSPRPGCKSSLKARSKITSLSKFKTKPHLGISGTKSKSKNKFGTGEKISRENRSKTAIGLPHTPPKEDAKTLLKTKLPASELRIYAKNIITDILEIIVKELERVAQNRAMLNTKALPSDQILEASKIVNSVLQELYATNNHNLASPINVSNLGDFRISKQNLGAGSPTEQQACFYLENVSSQLEQIFPKEGIFKKMFDKWQAETSDTENEKSKLLTVAESILTEISIKVKDLEYSLSLLNLPPLEDCGNRFYDRFKGGPTRAEDTKAQINMFGREIVEMLFEKLQLCFLSQMPIQDSKGMLTSQKEYVAAKSKHGVPSKHILSGVQTCNMKTKMSRSPSNQIVQEIIQRVLNMLESFVDLKFKHISKYEFSEIVKMPIDNLFQVQQRQLSKKMLPKLQPFRKFGDEPKSSTSISKENIQNTLLQVHSFHSELLAYSVTTVSDMLSIIKNKLDKEISQMEPYPVSILKENIAASEIIGRLIDQCTHFSESLIAKLPNKNYFKRTENVYIVNQVEFASHVKMPTSKMRNTSVRSNTPQRSVSGLTFNSEDDTKEKYGITSNSPSHISSCVENNITNSEPMGRPNSKAVPSCSVNKAQDQSQRKPNFGIFEEATKGNSSLPEGSMLQKLFKKANDSTEESLRQVMSFIEMGKGENPRVFHYETTKPIEPNEIKTNASPLKICLAADNIVNTVLSCYGFPHQPHPDESLETMKPFFMPRQNPFSVVDEGEKNEKNLLRMWCKRMTCINEEKSEGLEACQEDFSLLHKWKNKNSKMTAETLEETDTIAFVDHELGPNEMHLLARHITTSVITHLKNAIAAVSTEELSHVPSLPKKKYDSKQPLKSIYSNSSMYQFCEHLSESVICYLISNISDGTKEGSKDKAWEIQKVISNKNISIHSQVYKSRSISIGELALSIFEVIIEILSNGNIIFADKAHQTPIKTKYRFCPSVISSDFDDIFQDLLKGVIFVLSNILGINHFENNVRNKSYSTFRNSGPIFNKVNTTESQIGPRDWESSPHLIDHLAQRNKLNYLERRLNGLVGNLKSHESKDVINEVFNIVLDLFLPDDFPDGDMCSGKSARTFFTSNNQQSDRILASNLGLSPKSIFLLNIVCEKLIRTLLEKCTSTAFLEDSSLFREVAEECQHVKLLRSVQGRNFDYCKAPMSCEQFQGDYMSDLSENLEDMDQDLLSSDCILDVMSHSLVKSLMDKLSHDFQQAPFENKCMNYRTRETQPFSPEAKRRELIELGQTNAHVGFMSYDNNYFTKSMNNSKATSFKMQTPFGKQHTVKPFSLLLPERQETRGMNTVAFHKLCPRGANGGVYSATFLEDIISELFFKLSTSLWRKNINITETWLNEINTSLINNVVNDLNNAQITVLRYPEERLYFPSAHKGCVTKIVDSIYYDVLQKYEFKVTCGGNLPYDNTSVAEQMSNSILLEIVDYQLPSCFKGKLRSHSYHTLNAEIILYKLQNNLRKFISEPISSKGYSTMLPHSFLEYVIRKLLAQLMPLPFKPSSLEKQYLMTSDFDEMSNCITNKVMSAISKHKIWFTIYDNQCLHTDKNLKKMVDSVYSNIIQMSGSLDLIQKNIINRSPIMIDQIASFIIQEIIENHLQPFLCGETLPRPKTPLDEVSYMVKQVLNEVVESHKLQKPSPLQIYPDKFVGEIVTRVLSKIFSPKPNTNVELENMTQKIINSVNNHLDKTKIPILCDKQSSFPFSDADIVDELVTSVYRNVLKQHGLDPDIDESENGEAFVENIAKLIIAAISDYLLHPLFSCDLSAAPCSNSMADDIVYDILGNIDNSTKSKQSLPPYNTLLPYTFLEDMIRVLLSKFFPSPKIVLNITAPKDKGVNFNEIASNLISDIRRKISQHEIRFSKDEDKAKSFYSEDDVCYLVDSVFTNILENSSSQESVEQNITKTNDVFIDKIAGFIIKYICEQHLQPFVEKRQISTSPYKCFVDRQPLIYASAYSSTFLEDVVSGVVSKIFHRVIGIVQVESTRNSEDVLFDKAENLIYWITEEFSKAQVTTIENAEKQLCFSPVEKDVLKNIIDTVYSKVLKEYEMGFMPDKDFLNDTKALAGWITKIILTEIFDFQIPPALVANLPLSLHSKLSQNVLVNRVHYEISKSRFRRQASTIYTTMLSHIHLEKIVTQLMSQISPSHSSVEHSDTPQSDLSNTVMKLINEIMSIISKHAICIVKHGNEKQSMISEKDIQSMVDSIYADLSHSNLYQHLTKDKKGISSIPVSKIASFIIKEIFNHHLESFLSGDKSFLSPSVAQPCKQKSTNPKQRELSFIMNSAIFLEEVISELLCKILQTFIQDSLTAETSEKAIAQIMDIATTLVKSVVLEFTTSEILLAENLDESLWFSETYKEVVQKTVNSVYENILDEYKSLTQLHRTIQNDTTCFGGKLYHFLLQEIYDYQVQSLVSGELMPSSYSFPRAENIIKNVLNVTLKDTNVMPSCITVLPCSLIENMIYKLLVNIFPSDDTTNNKLKEKEVGPDDNDEFMAAASKLTDEIIKEISEHEIRFATAEENEDSMQLGTTENFIDSVCNNILKNSEFQAEVQKDAHKKGGSFLSKTAGFIIKAIMDHHLQPFLYGEDSPSSNLPEYGHASVVAKSGKEKAQTSLFSAAFLEDVIVDLAHKFCSFATLAKDSMKKDIPEPEIVSLAINFANSLIREFRKSEIKVLPHAEEIFSFPPIGKETVDAISNFVYDQFIGKLGSDGIQKDDTGNIIIEMVSSLAQKAISAFKIQPLFSGDWCSTFFSFLDAENITQRVQLLPEQTSMQISRLLKQSQLVLSEDTSMKKDDIHHPIINSVATFMKSSIIDLISGSTTGVTDTKKDDDNKLKSATLKYENASKATSPATSVKSKDPQVQHLSDKCKSNETGKENLVLINKQGKTIEIYTHFAVATVNNSSEEVLESDFITDNEKKIDNASQSLVKIDEKPKSESKDNITKKTLKIAQQPVKEERTQSVAETDINEELYTETERVENVIENIYDNVLTISSQEPLDFSRPIYSKSLSSDKALVKLQDSAQPVATKDSFPSVNRDITAKQKASEEAETKRKEESEIKREKEIKSQPSKTNHPQSSSESEPRIISAKFLEDVIIEMVNKLIFTSSPETETCDRTPDASGDQNQGELYDTALKLIDSMFKEFSDAETKVFRTDKGKKISSRAIKDSSAHMVPPGLKEATTEEPSSNMNIKNVNKLPHEHKTVEQSSSDKMPSINRMLSIEKSVVNKIVHSCVCDVLKECASQESVCKTINNNRENLAKRLTSTVINEIFQHQLNLIFSDEIPASGCVPLESKDVEEKVQKAVQTASKECNTASKECQTSSPYTIKLPFKFLDDVISAFLAKVFSKLFNVKTKISQQNLLTQLDFLKMKLVSMVASEIAKNEDLNIQYVDSLHPNDDEIIQLVVQTIYNNLLPQFGSQETIQNCVVSGCKFLSKTIVDLVLREVAGNQLQNYFGGELTPYQCAEVDNVVENILTNVVLTTPSQPPRPRKLSYNIIEAIAVKFLSKLLSGFPKVHSERTESQEIEMQKIISKILKSIQECFSKSKIKVVQPAKESEPVPVTDNATIDKVVNSVYANLLKQSGSPTSVLEDLMGKSNVLSDIIGSSMVKEISNSEFQPQAEEELSSSELALEAVKIMEKVVKIIDELKSQEKSSSVKDLVLDSRVLEEALALFLAKIIKKPGVASKDMDSLTKPELNKIASQLTKSVTAEISRSNINLVDSNPEEQSLAPENIEMISQAIESVYDNIINQSETCNEPYDMKGTKKAFPKKVASLIVDGVSNVPSCRVSTMSSYTAAFGDLDTSRIIEKAQKHAAQMNSDSDKESDDVLEDELPIRIIPHVGNKPLRIDPNIISEHLAVISMKTQPLETLNMDCIKRTGCSITELRRASISGNGHSSPDVSESGKRQKERRISLDRTGRLDVKSFEAVGRNSFQNIRRPDITRVELLKDIHNKKDLIVRLVAHDTSQKDSESNFREDIISDEEEIILGEVIGHQCLGGISAGHGEEVVKALETKVVSPKTTMSASSLRKFLALSKCCQPTSGENIESIGTFGNQAMKLNKTHVKRVVAELDIPSSKSLAEGLSSKDKLQYKKEERLATEPTHYFIHRIMSTSSYNQEDLLSSEAEEVKPDPKANALEERSQQPQAGNSSCVQFVTIFEGSKRVTSSTHPSKEHISETSKSTICKQGSKVLAKVSSTLSKVFSRSSGSIPKSSSPPHQDKY
ncbi:fibrous sheath-interacting protein 2-like isoform X2 [Peromyscus californicus insignis]|uniref:fibrous sheath-interacting protein 2-like isoform X2 n=1 Tax=Peromyscus californicus insignis TaxID=564181 RepID=UPI0022A78939|nr:fibrous sheath-interacting protein 2-like isoform X2 [Peromyscus californicus insignis]